MATRHISSPRAAVIATRARAKKFELTFSEQKLWSAIRGGRLGVQFRRQVAIGRYIADFFALQCGLVVEVDGGYHGRRRGPDARRDEAMRSWGLHVLRLEEELVVRDLPAAVARIREELGRLGA
jgi:very-short-patch-repair endonuclease